MIEYLNYIYLYIEGKGLNIKDNIANTKAIKEI